jgi:hypothetical protein
MPLKLPFKKRLFLKKNKNKVNKKTKNHKIKKKIKKNKNINLLQLPVKAH